MEELQDAIANVITGRIDQRMTNSPFITILVGVGTDITINKKLCIDSRLSNKSTIAGETVVLQNVEVATHSSHNLIGWEMA